MLLDKNPHSIDKSETWGAEPLAYANQIHEDCNKLLTPEFKSWLGQINESDDFKNNLNRFISLQKLIKDEDPGKQRKYFLDEARKVENELTGE